MLSNGLNQKDMTYRSMNRPRNSGFFVPIPERYPLMNEHKPNRSSPMIYAIAGSSVMDAAQFNESQLERLTRQLRAGWKGLIDFLTQPGQP